MKLPPASRKASRTRRLSSFDEPQPQSSPKVIVPRQSSETRRPDLPSSRYRIADPPLGNAETSTAQFGLKPGTTSPRPPLASTYWPVTQPDSGEASRAT